MGAPLGNQNRHKATKWQDALKRALSRKGGSLQKGLEMVADQVVDKAINEGDWNAIKEIGERMDGKAPQTTHFEGEIGVYSLAELIAGRFEQSSVSADSGVEEQSSEVRH